MKHFDPNLNSEVRRLRSDFISGRETQLHQLAKDAGETVIKYLFITNSGGAVAVLAYLGAYTSQLPAPLSAKYSLVFFFLGIICVGAHKALAVHRFEILFKKYQNLIAQYYDQKIGWDEIVEQDEHNVGRPVAPYILGYSSFVLFILGCISGAAGLFCA